MEELKELDEIITENKNKNENTNCENNIQGRSTSFQLEGTEKGEKELILLEEQLKKDVPFEISPKLLDESKSIYVLLNNIRDFIILFSLFLFPSFNFNYLNFIFILIGIIYNCYILENKKKDRNMKFYLQISTIIYSFFLIAFKLLIFIMFKSNESLIYNKKSIFINLGISFLIHDIKLYYMITFTPESAILIILIISLLFNLMINISDEEIEKRYYLKITLYSLFIKMRNYLFICFLIISGFAVINKSILSIIFMIPIYLLLFLYSLDIQRIVIYSLFMIVSKILLFILIIYILIINITNVNNIAHFFISNNNDQNRFLVLWRKFGFYFSFYIKGEKNINIENLLGYFFSSLSIVTFSFCIKSITMNELMLANIDLNQEEKNKGKTISSNKLYDKLASICRNPYYFLHICRMMAIIWLFIFPNFYSLSIFIWLYFSFIIGHVTSAESFTKVFLIPFIFLSLFSIFISRIDGIFEFSDEKKEKYFNFALGKYNFDYLRAIFCTLFYFFANYFLYILIEDKKQTLSTTPTYEEQNKDKNKSEIKNNIEEKTSTINNLVINDSVNNSNNNISIINYDSNFSLEDNSNQKVEDILKFKDNDEKKSQIEINKILAKIDLEKLTLGNLIFRYIIKNIDKLTLIVMYIIAFKNINIIHLIILLILCIQLLVPEAIKAYSIAIIQILEILFFIGYIMDLAKVYNKELFKDNIITIKFYLNYNESNDSFMEIYYFFLVYCVYIQYQFYNYKEYKQIEENEDINIKNYIEKILSKYEILKKIIDYLIFAIMKIYIWLLISLFILSTFLFEINLLFGIELTIFLIVIYLLMLFILEPYKKKLTLKPSKLLLFYSSFYIFTIFIYQIICHPNTDIKNKIDNSKNFFIKNLPSIGFTKFEEDQLYRRMMPHFLSNFVSLLITSEIKRTIKDNDKKLLENYINRKKSIETEEKEENEEQMKTHKKESPAQLYQKNADEMSILNLKNYFFKLVIFMTKLYWLFIFMSICILFTTKYLTVGMIIYIIIFGLAFIFTFFSIVKTLDNFIKKESYLISKLLRTSFVEIKMHNIEIHSCRKITFGFLFGINCFYLIFIYISGVIYLFENGCNPDFFKGCDINHQSFFSKNNEDKRDKMLSIFYLFGFYVDLSNNILLSASWAYLFLFYLIGLDVYVQQLEYYYTNLSNKNRIKYKDLDDKNIKLKPFTMLGEDNIIANITNFLASKDKPILKAKSHEIRPTLLGNNYENNLNIIEMEKNIYKDEGLEEKYKDLFEKVENILKNKNISFSEKDKYEGRKILMILLEKFEKASSYDPKLSKSNNINYIIKVIKKIYEESILFLLIFDAIFKLNIWSFIYMLYSLFLILTPKSIKKYYILFCFLIVSIIGQNIIFATNININTDPGKSERMCNIMESSLNIPWYKRYTTDENGFFFGMGVNSLQISAMWIDYIEIIFIYIYLYYFSYSIYHDVRNKGKANKGIDKINYYNLHLNEKVKECVKNLNTREFKRHHNCMKSNFNIDIGAYEEFRNKILFIKTINSQVELKEIKNKNVSVNYNRPNNNFIISKDSIALDDQESPLVSALNKAKNLNYTKKNINNESNNSQLLDIIKKLIYLSSHTVIIIIIMVISMLVPGLLSVFYIIFSLFFLMKSNAMYIGIPYYYPKSIKSLLRFAILIDIGIQMFYQTPYLSPSSKNNSTIYTILNIVGFKKIIDFGNKKADSFSINTDEVLLVLFKAITYYFISLQILIYSSQDFQEFYLTYLLTKNINLRRITLMNTFKYNNERIEAMGKSITLRQEMDSSMAILEKKLEYWSKTLFNIKDKSTKEKLETKSKLNNRNNLNNAILNQDNKEKKKFDNEKKEEKINAIKNKTFFDTIGIDINKNEIDEESNTDESENEEEKLNKYVDEDVLKEKIKSWIFGSILMKIQLWLHKNASSYNSIDEDERDEYEKEIIQGRTTITSMLESMVEKQLNTINLNGFKFDDLKEIKKYFDGSKQVDENKNSKFKNKVKKIILLNKLKNIKKKNLLKDNNITNIDSSHKEKTENEESNEIDKFKVLDNFTSNYLFVKYLKTSYIIKCIIEKVFDFFIDRFHWPCYCIMIIDHMSNPTLLSSFYPLSIFLYAILESPRPNKNYWNICLLYSVILICLKYIIQLDLIIVILKKQNYLDLAEKMVQYKIGLVHYETTFSFSFFKYIFYDSLVIIFLLLNNYLLLSKGIWTKRENEIESIYQAMERIGTTKHLKLLTIKETKQFNLRWLFGSGSNTSKSKGLFSKKYSTVGYGEKNEHSSEIERNRTSKTEGGKTKIKHNKPSFYQKIQKSKNLSLNIIDDIAEKQMKPINFEKYNENNRTYFQRLFPKIRNEKPGRDYYFSYTISMLLIIFYLILFYTNMNQDKTYGSILVERNQFSSNMIVFLIIHVIFLFYDRVIYIMQNRNNLKYDYIIYDKNTCAPISEIEFNQIKSDISLKYNNLKREHFVIPTEYIDEIKDKYNIIYIQNEEFNFPLLQKYVLHLLITIFSHFFIFFYLPMKGNYNIGNAIYCIQEETCNDFNYNNFLIFFYLIYVAYLIPSGLQIKYGFYDLRRTSTFKSGHSSINGMIFSVYKAIPFIYEIKSAIDWTFTSTCLDYFQWNKFESAYDTLYSTYCNMTSKNSQKVGQKVNIFKKIGIGGSMSFGLILLLIIPIMLFSSLNPTNELNNILGATLKIDLSILYQNGASKNYTLFKNSKPNSIKDFFPDDENDWKKYNYSKSIETKNFPHKQIQKVEFSKESDRKWNMAKPQILKLINILENSVENNHSETEAIFLTMEYTFERHLPVEAQKASDRIDFILFQNNEMTEEKNITQIEKIKELKEVLKCNDKHKVIFNNLYSVPLRLTANIKPVVIEDENYIYSFDFILGFEGCGKNNDDEIDYIESYFTLEKINKDGNPEEGLVFHCFSDKASSSTSGYSVLTFYVSFILLVGNYVRNFFGGEAEKISLLELPHPESIILLCKGIQVSRYSFDYEQEEKLYYILMELMRSPDYLKILTESSIEQYEERKKINK